VTKSLGDAACIELIHVGGALGGRTIVNHDKSPAGGSK
jgi:hypothetical protein